MSSATMVFGAALRRSEKWRVFRIRTANSTYELEVESVAHPQARRCAVLTCVAPQERSGESFTDASPQADGQSLFALSPLDWMGKRLCVGTARTSEVQAVDFIGESERAQGRDRVISKLAPAPPSQPRQESNARAWSAYPLNHVEFAETAAALLKLVVHRHDVFAALKDDSLAERRMTLALADCRLMLEALSRRS